MKTRGGIILVKAVRMEFYKEVCKRCPLFEEFLEENPKGQAIINCKPFICPILWEEGWKNLSHYRKRKLKSVFSVEDIKKWRKSLL